MRIICHLIESFRLHALSVVLIAGILMSGFMASSCSINQQIKYRIVGQVDDDASLYVETPTRNTPEGYASGYMWIDKPASEGIVTVKTLAPENTRMGYLSKNRIPVDCSCAGGSAQLILLPLEAARGVTEEKVSLGITNSPRMGLRLEYLDQELTSFRFRLSPERGVTLFETDDVGGYWFYRRGKMIQRIEQCGNYALLTGTNLFLLRMSNWGADYLDLQLYRQPAVDGNYLYLNYEQYLDWIRDHSRLKLEILTGAP